MHEFFTFGKMLGSKQPSPGCRLESLLSIADCGEPPSHEAGRKLALHRHRTRLAKSTKRRYFLLWTQLIAALDDLLLGREVGYIKRPASFDHFVIRAGDARGPFERLFARLHLNMTPSRETNSSTFTFLMTGFLNSSPI